VKIAAKFFLTGVLFFVPLGVIYAVWSQGEPVGMLGIPLLGGLVGMIGGLGGFVLPLLFGVLNDITGIWSSCFMALFVLILLSLGWMHTAIRRRERRLVAQPA